VFNEHIKGKYKQKTIRRPRLIFAKAFWKRNPIVLNSRYPFENLH
jgi:hypothetical protein